MLLKFLIINIILGVQAQLTFYFTNGTPSKSLNDMTNTTVDFEAEVRSDTALSEAWDAIVNNYVPNHNINATLEEMVIMTYTTSFYFGYNQALREWYNSSNNSFKYYWFTKLFMSSAYTNSSGVLCYRGIAPRKVGNIYQKINNFSVDDLIYSNQMESFSLDRELAERAAQPEKDPGFKGAVMTMRVKHYINALMWSVHRDERELIVPPGDLFVVEEAKKYGLDNFDEYLLEYHQ